MAKKKQYPADRALRFGDNGECMTITQPKKKMGKNRTPVRKRATIWTTANAVYAYLNTIKEREMPGKQRIFDCFGDASAKE